MNFDFADFKLSPLAHQTFRVSVQIYLVYYKENPKVRLESYSFEI